MQNPNLHAYTLLLRFFLFNKGTPGAGHTDKLGRLKELCEQYNMWLHVEGYET